MFKLEFLDRTATGFLEKNFLREELIYGDSDCFSSLITPTISIFAQRLIDEIHQDMQEIWHLYYVANNLYIQSLRDNNLIWFRAFAENGLTPVEIDVQRLIAKEKLQPRFGRIDYITIEPSRKISEIQWKSGGLGLFSGIQDVYSRLIKTPDTYDEIKIIDGIQKLVQASIEHQNGIALNCVRLPWLRSEQYLSRTLAPMGNFFSVTLKDILYHYHNPHIRFLFEA